MVPHIGLMLEEQNPSWFTPEYHLRCRLLPGTFMLFPGSEMTAEISSAPAPRSFSEPCGALWLRWCGLWSMAGRRSFGWKPSPPQQTWGCVSGCTPRYCASHYISYYFCFLSPCFYSECDWKLLAAETTSLEGLLRWLAQHALKFDKGIWLS